MTDVHELVGCYAVHALSASEAEAFEAHLAGCADCRRELAEFAEVTTELARLAETAPPASVRSAVLNQLSVGAPVARLDGRRRRAPRAWIAVAAAAALIAIGAGGWAVNLNQRLHRQQVAQAQQNEQNERQRARQQADDQAERQAAERESAILRAPDARVYSADTGSGGRVSYIISKQQNAGVMVTGALADPPSGKTYQLWTVRVSAAGKPAFVPDVTFGGGSDQRIFFTTSVNGAGAVGLSVETAGGATTPTTTPFAVATL